MPIMRAVTNSVSTLLLMSILGLLPVSAVAENPIADANKSLLKPVDGPGIDDPSIDDATLCEDLVDLNAEEPTIDGDIQDKLKNIYYENNCYINAAEQQGAPLTDGKVGIVTKKWINQALIRQAADTRPEPLRLDKADTGIQPYVLLEPDLTWLSINYTLIEALTAFTEDEKTNSFVSESQAWEAINTTLSEIEGYEALASDYEKIIRPMIHVATLRIIYQDALDELIAEDLEEEAAALSSLLEKPIRADEFSRVIDNVLSKVFKKRQAEAEIVRAEKAEKKQQDAKVKQEEKKVEEEKLKEAQEEEINTAKAELAKVGDAFKLKLDEITQLSDDSKGLKNFLAGIANKVASLVGLGETKQDKPDEEFINDEASVEKIVDDLDALKAEGLIDDDDAILGSDVLLVMFRVLNREIKKHRDLADKFTSKDDSDKADDESYIANELQLMYHREVERFEKNIKIVKGDKPLNVNDEEDNNNKSGTNDEQTQSTSSDETDDLDENLAQSTEPLLNIKKAEELIAQRAMYERRYRLVLADDLAKIFPGIPKTVANCAVHFINQSYPNAHTLSRAVMAMLQSLDDEAAWLKANPGESNQDRSFQCELEVATNPAATINKYADENLARIIVDRATKKFYSSDLRPITLKVLPACTDCSLPTRGTNYGFYPYWQASDIYAQLGLPETNPGAVDYSVFTRMAYFALPIEDNGEIKQLLHWEKTNIALISDFVKTLNRHNVKRDIVLYSKNWCHWGQPKDNKTPCAALGEYKSNIDVKSAIYGYAETHYALLKKLNERVKGEGGLSGVTLYFDDYSDKIDATNIVDYVNHLNKQMTTDNSSRNFDINLMLGIKGLDENSVKVGEKITADQNNYFKKIESLFLHADSSNEIDVNIETLSSDMQSAASDILNEDDEANTPAVNKILVFLNEQTSPYKKELRMQIENEFSGGTRVDAQLAVVPIIGRARLGEESQAPYRQHLDDLAYLKYNFGGIGLWNLPLTGYNEEGTLEDTNEQMALFSHVLKKDYGDQARNYMDYGRIGIVGTIFHDDSVQSVIDICGKACPRRGFYSTVFIVLTLVLIFIKMFMSVSCSVRFTIKRISPAYFGLYFLWLAVFFALLGCHPSWQAISRQIWIVFIVFVLSYGVYKMVANSYEQEI